MSANPAANRRQFRAYVNAREDGDILRFITCGSVDDGKSTLIGRLLYESRLVFQDQLAKVEADSRLHGTQGDNLDLALLLDGLQAEREQGITIDVAYRMFSTGRRKFIVADAPGHESTRATWPPAPQPPISRWCSSMRARACCPRPAATPPFSPSWECAA